MNGDDLELNSVRRFAKRVSNLTLEEQGHCEVPAGCGGLVLRWRNPDFGIPVTIRTYPGQDVAVFLDGQPLAIGRTDLSYGPHVMAARLTFRDEAPLFMAVITEIQSRVRPPGEAGTDVPDPWRIATAADGNWRYSTQIQDDEAWMRPGYDDSHWAPLEPAPKGSAPDKSSYWISSLAEAGAALLGPADQPSPTSRQLRLLGRKLGLAESREHQLHIRGAFDLKRSA